MYVISEASFIDTLKKEGGLTIDQVKPPFNN